MRASYICPALTLFGENQEPDFEGQAALYENLIKNRIDGILVLGSLGEFFALPLEKKRELARFAVKAIGGRTRLILGTSSMVFDEAVRFSNDCLGNGRRRGDGRPALLLPTGRCRVVALLWASRAGDPWEDIHLQFP